MHGLGPHFPTSLQPYLGGPILYVMNFVLAIPLVCRLFSDCFMWLLVLFTLLPSSLLFNQVAVFYAGGSHCIVILYYNIGGDNANTKVLVPQSPCMYLFKAIVLSLP